MSTFNPYAVYVKCDGAMEYDSKNTGGIGFVIEFPDSIELESIKKIIGRYEGANIERLELNAILKGMTELLKTFIVNQEELKNVNTIIFITDRYSLNDEQKTNSYKIREYKKNRWRNHEDKPIKNADLLDAIDKMRKKLSEKTRCSVRIEFRPRKQNKVADKLAEAGKLKTTIDKSLAKNGIKICKRKFDGDEIDYSLIKENLEIFVRIFKKELVSDKWEVWCEIFDGDFLGKKFKIYTDRKLEKLLHRTYLYKIKVKKVYRYHLEIFRTICKVKK